MLSGSRIIASGFSCAHLRAATATSARCSRVVPYWCIWRAAASAYEVIGDSGLYGFSYGCGSSTARTFEMPARPTVEVRWLLP
ncbi:hypothetical protein D3C72_1598150 [compost metagenome]